MTKENWVLFWVVLGSLAILIYAFIFGDRSARDEDEWDWYHDE